MRYNPALDGLRAFAVLIVTLFHARAPWVSGGFIGVDVFFVLSGYLITSLLLAELDRHGRIDVMAFWGRRLLRLTPALLAMLAVYVLVAPLAWPETKDHGAQAGLAALYLSDYTVAFWGTPTRLSHTWSLSVEMQFYLLWPLVLALAWKRWKNGNLASVLLGGWILATLLRWVCTVLGQEWGQVYYRADTHASGLLLGAWLAAALRQPAWRAALHRLLPWLLWLAVAGMFLLRQQWGSVWMQVWGLALAEWATVPLLVALQRPTSQLATMFSQPVLVWLGRMSYGVYLWHYPVFSWLRDRTTWDVVVLAGLPLSLALAALSFYTLESWAARWRGGRAAMRPAS
jgi:peptidoglycan/LPS O-acetylase OafA/YrhL